MVNQSIIKYELNQPDSTLPKVNIYYVPGINTLIDCGPNDLKAFLDFKTKFENNGFQISDIKRIILTHHHIDHIGMLVFFPRNIEVIVNSNAMNFQGSETFTKIIRFVDKNYHLDDDHKKDIIYRLLSEYDCAESLKARPVKLINHETMIDQFLLIPTMGHSSSDLLIFDTFNDILFSGDVLLPGVYFNVILEFKDTGWCTLRQEYSKELLKLRLLNCDFLYPGHGEIFEKSKLNKLIENNTKRMNRTNKKVLRNKGKDITIMINESFKNFLQYSYFLPFSETIGILRDLSTVTKGKDEKKL